MKLKAVRGAIYAENSREIINERVVELYCEMVCRNALETESIVCVIVSTTTDLTVTCPATAIRKLYEKGKNPSLFSVNEPEFDGAEKGIIRLMILAYTENSNHVYLRGTNKLIGENHENSN